VIKIESSDVLLEVFHSDFKLLQLLMLSVSDGGEFRVIATVLFVEVLLKHSQVAADKYAQVFSLDVKVIEEYPDLGSEVLVGL
jgi:hypothetical protein